MEPDRFENVWRSPRDDFVIFDVLCLVLNLTTHKQMFPFCIVTRDQDTAVVARDMIDGRIYPG